MGKSSVISQSQVCNILQYVHICQCFWTMQIGGEFHDDRMNEMQEIKEARSESNSVWSHRGVFLTSKKVDWCTSC